MSDAVSNSERRSSRLISARLLPAAASPSSCFSPASAPGGGGALDLDGRLHAREDRLDPLPLVDAADALQDHGRHRRLERDQDVVGELALAELELARRPEEEVEDRLLGLRLERALQVVLAQQAVAHQDRAQEPPLLLLREQRAEELLLGDEAEADQELAERLARVVRPGGEDVALAQDDALLDRAPLDVERARLLPRGDPLQDVGQRHRPQVTAEAHDSGFSGAESFQLSSQARSQNR